MPLKCSKKLFYALYPACNASLLWFMLPFTFLHNILNMVQCSRDCNFAMSSDVSPLHLPLNHPLPCAMLHSLVCTQWSAVCCSGPASIALHRVCTTDPLLLPPAANCGSESPLPRWSNPPIPRRGSEMLNVSPPTKYLSSPKNRSPTKLSPASGSHQPDPCLNIFPTFSDKPSLISNVGTRGVTLRNQQVQCFHQTHLMITEAPFKSNTQLLNTNLCLILSKKCESPTHVANVEVPSWPGS